MTSELDLDKVWPATFEGLLSLFAEDLGADHFEELVTDPAWREILATRHDFDKAGDPLGPYYVQAFADESLEIVLGLMEDVASIRAENPEVTGVLEGVVALAYSVGRMMAIGQLTDGDGAIMALAERGRKGLMGNSAGGAIRASMLARHERALRMHWALFAEKIYDPSVPSVRPWTLGLLASRVHSEAPLAPCPSDWKDLTDKDKAFWTKRQNWNADRISDQLAKAVTDSPGRWAFQDLVTKR